MPDDLIDHHRDLLAQVAARGDRDAFRALFVHFGPRVKSLMMRAGADSETADDIVQDVMAAVWRKTALYDAGKGSVGAWVYAIARNARIDRLRRKSSQPYEDIDQIEIAADEPSSEDRLVSAQNAHRVGEALRALPAEQRQIIDLAFAGGLSQTDIAARLSLPLGTVKSRMRLAYGRLRANLMDLK